jgi:tRNA A-37 threonylcarbamoyl transferase component Bud32
MSADLNSPISSTRLNGKSLILVRLAWWGITIFTVVYTIASLHTILIEKPVLAKPLWFFSDKESILLKQIGVLSASYIVYIIILGAIAGLMFFVAACLIFWWRSDDWQAILLSVIIITIGLTNIFRMGIPLAYAHRGWLILFLILFLIMTVGILIMIFTFPDGRFIPRWTRWVVAPYVIFTIVRGVFAVIGIDKIRMSLFLIDQILLGICLLAQIYRYRRFSNPSQRQQTKWIIYGFALNIIVNITDGYLLFPLYFPLLNGLSAKFYFFVYFPLIYVVPTYIPILAFFFSILRYRLWDIDFVINRSLVYGALTALLAALFGGSLFIVSQLFQNYSGGPLVAVAVSATVFGGIFQPTRRQIQRFVDQRFYHIEIDYQKIPPNLATDGMTQILRQTSFGMYKNLELIGRGGMAEVYKSMHPTTGKPVAIKILPKALASETEFRQRFTREAQVVSQLEHPNIIRIFDSGEEEGQYYMVMEYLTGQDLDRLIKNNGKLPFSQVLPLIQQIASALDYAHTQGFVHRDIKPSNVLLDSNGTRAVLTDFGIAKVNDTHTVMTVTGHILGTFDYIAPEQIQESSHVDGKADIYALGVMVYQMLTGQLPFKHNNAGALLIVHLNQPAPDACEILSDLPRNVGVAIQRAMAKKPEERFSTAKEFAAVIG